jgi:hypothetical protein
MVCFAMTKADRNRQTVESNSDRSAMLVRESNINESKQKSTNLDYPL